MRTTLFVFALLAGAAVASAARADASFYTDSSGVTSGTVDGESFSAYTDPSGVTTGTVGGRSFSCYSDPSGVTTCN
jgi:hypothetical protein